jgi:hypothetical protein
VAKVNAALEQYAAALGSTAYELHAICGVNEDVSGPNEIPSTDTSTHLLPYRYDRSHMNFLATTSFGGEPVLFFAECRNYDDVEDEQAPLCVPVGIPPPRASLVRCLYCDSKGGNIVHPASTEFHGRDKEFEAAARGGTQVQQLHRNEEIIQRSDHDAQCIYYDSDGASSDGDRDLLSMCEFDE